MREYTARFFVIRYIFRSDRAFDVQPLRTHGEVGSSERISVQHVLSSNSDMSYVMDSREDEAIVFHNGDPMLSRWMESSKSSNGDGTTIEGVRVAFVDVRRNVREARSYGVRVVPTVLVRLRDGDRWFQGTISESSLSQYIRRVKHH